MKNSVGKSAAGKSSYAAAAAAYHQSTRQASRRSPSSARVSPSRSSAVAENPHKVIPVQPRIAKHLLKHSASVTRRTS
jgi:hypothetical protein